MQYDESHFSEESRTYLELDPVTERKAFRVLCGYAQNSEDAKLLADILGISLIDEHSD